MICISCFNSICEIFYKDKFLSVHLFLPHRYKLVLTQIVDKKRVIQNLLIYFPKKANMYLGEIDEYASV